MPNAKGGLIPLLRVFFFLWTGVIYTPGKFFPAMPPAGTDAGAFNGKLVFSTDRGYTERLTSV
jgi:hypothetical protein